MTGSELQDGVGSVVAVAVSSTLVVVLVVEFAAVIVAVVTGVGIDKQLQAEDKSAPGVYGVNTAGFGFWPVSP